MKRQPRLKRFSGSLRVGVVLLLAGSISACDKFDLVPEDGPVPGEVMEKAKDVIGKSKETAGKAADWTEDDLRKIGAWEYRVVRFEDSSDEALQEDLNRLGAERWECYWVEETTNGPRFYFKKTKRSYLRYVPISDLMRVFLPDGAP